MKVALISPYESTASVGVRTLSAVLRAQGFETKLFFIPLPFEVPYGERLVQGLSDLLSDCQVVGISLTSNYFERAVQLTTWLRQAGSWRILWGGIHPTLEPQECLEHADYVVLGEAEKSLPALLSELEGDLSQVRGIGYRTKSETGDWTAVINEPMPLIHQLDEIPFQDYSCLDHYLWCTCTLGTGGTADRNTAAQDDSLAPAETWQPMTPELLLANTRGDYLTLSSRGCPFRCTFCCNSFLGDYYKGSKWFRLRSIENLLDEAHFVKREYSYFNRIFYDDDAFMARPASELRTFARRMKEEIGLPFVVTGVTPNNLTEEKLEILLDGGLQWIRLGVQTTSERVNRDVYNRQTSLKSIKRAVEIIRKYHHRMDRVWYDFIIDNPWETQEETLDTLRFMLTLPKPFALCIYSLTYFPKTRIATRAAEEGILSDRSSQVYKKSYKSYQSTYINNLFLFFTLSRLPRWVLSLFVNPWVMRFGLHRPLMACHTVLRKAKSRFLRWRYERAHRN